LQGVIIYQFIEIWDAYTAWCIEFGSTLSVVIA